LSDERTVSGALSHHAWIETANSPSTVFQNRNHCAYPTIQFQRTNASAGPTPVCTEIYVWADFDLQDREGQLEDQWLSFATFTDDVSDDWQRTVLVNVNHRGEVHLQHTPTQGQQEHIFQSPDITFPYREWAKLTVELDFSATCFAKAWLNDVLVSHAEVRGVQNRLAQAHFGLYASPSLESGEILNDKLSIVAGRCLF
jgi:hypothetical protein